MNSDTSNAAAPDRMPASRAPTSSTSFNAFAPALNVTVRSRGSPGSAVTTGSFAAPTAAVNAACRSSSSRLASAFTVTGPIGVNVPAPGVARKASS